MFTATCLSLLLLLGSTSSPPPTPTPTPGVGVKRDEQVTVTANRTPTRVSDTAAAISIVTEEDLALAAAPTLDDALRQTPGFSLFRRSGSRTANPTAQGVSLRGLGASGASRAAVLSDGVPLNDPFGGWVYWGRSPRLSIDRVEVVRGGASSLYGADALGGVINLVPRRTSVPVLAIETSYGGQRSPMGSLFTGGRKGALGAQFAAEHFQTGGYILVDEAQRGPVDTRAGVRYSTVEVTVDREVENGSRFFLRGSLFDESRENGTPLQTNGTYVRQVSSGASWPNALGGSLALRAHLGSQVYDQDFSAVTTGRSTESLTRRQRTPADHWGVSAQMSRGLGSRQALVAGLELRDVEGESDEVAFANARATSRSLSGGRERTLALFAQDVIGFRNRWIATVGARVDRWRNEEGRTTTTVLASNATTATAFAPRVETAFSPRVSLLYKASGRVSLTSSAYRAFRAPTLNELYRSFRVGNVLTQANASLLAERLTGAEAGLRYGSAAGRWSASASVFWSEITRPVANVTLSSTPALVTRERRNLGETRSRGLEMEVHGRFSETWSLTMGYLHVDPRVLSFSANPALEGRVLPQVARHQFTFQTRYAHSSSFTLAFQGRAAGVQFDDDQNLLPLDRLLVVDGFVSRSITRQLTAFVAVENLFDSRYEVGRSGVTTVGPPRSARVGLRLALGGGR